MRLKDFEKFFDDKILFRAKNYYENDAVISLDEVDKDEWEAEVEGTESYTVSVILSGDNIIYSECDCPYDLDSYCKHKGATFYALREKLKQDKAKSNEKKKKEDLKTILSRQEKDELVAVLLELAKKDKHIRNDLHLRYSDKTDIIKHSRDVIKNSINAVKRQGFVDYGDARKAIKGAEAVLGTIDEYNMAGDSLIAIKLCVVVLEEIVSLIGYCDDSNGECGYIIDEALERIVEAVDGSLNNSTDGEALFDTIFNHATSAKYNNWTHWRAELLQATIPLCCISANREKLDQYLSSSIDTKGDKYDKEREQELRLELISQLDGDSAAQQYIEANLDNDSFRMISICTAIDREQYDKALELCLEGERSAVKYQGLVRDYKKLRFKVYEITNNLEAQKELGFEFVVGGKFDYYPKLKSLYSNDEWAEVCENILDKTQPKRNDYFAYLDNGGIYVKILIAENMTLRLLDYCKVNKAAIIDNCVLLMKEYPADVEDIYRAYIFESAAKVSDRAGYRRVCEIIKSFKKVLSKDVKDIKQELLELYKKRPAFLDELGRIK